MDLPILLFYGFAFIGLVHSVIFSFLAIKNKIAADLIITLFLFIQSLIILEYVLFWTGLQESYHQLCNVSITTQFLFGPLLLLYIDYIFNERRKLKIYLFHFAPAIIVLILMLPYYVSTADLKIHHYKMIDYFVLDLSVLNYFLMAHMVGYCIYLFVKIAREKRVGHIKNWLFTIVGLFGFFIASYISYYIMVRYPWFTLTTDYFVSLGMCLSIVSIIYFAYGRTKILDGYPLKESLNLGNIYFSYREKSADFSDEKKKDQPIVYNYPSDLDSTVLKDELLAESEKGTVVDPVLKIAPVKYKNSGLTPDAGNELAEELKKLMQTERLYRESEIKLETLSAKLGVPKHYVSQIINQYYNVNYFEYINLLRIEDAKLLLLDVDNKSMNIIEVAYAVGYSTKNTFNNAFRRIVGVTPSEFRRQNQIRMN
ncbi:MAG: AraC family transcriptional regulator [Bacteroidia bacterium]|jgi:AraC-like DNA-binding protein|nr:AraC family transcriptional regulator [Bacteroidia bacterium]